jgi:hypothetical protein
MCEDIWSPDSEQHWRFLWNWVLINPGLNCLPKRTQEELHTLKRAASQVE